LKVVHFRHCPIIPRPPTRSTLFPYTTLFRSSPHSLLAAIAAQTRRVKVGVACTIVPWYHPLRLAQDLATLDIISEGRLIIGVGRSEEHTSELQSRVDLVCRLLLEKKKTNRQQ